MHMDIMISNSSGKPIYCLLYTSHAAVFKILKIGIEKLYYMIYNIDVYKRQIVDNTHGRFGKFKPWIALGALLSGACLLYTSDCHENDNRADASHRG